MSTLRFNTKTTALWIFLCIVIISIAFSADKFCLAQTPPSGGYTGPDSGISQPSGEPPQSVRFVGPEDITKSKVPCIVVFDNEDSKEIQRLGTKVKLFSSDAGKVCFVQVILTPEDIDMLFPKKDSKGNLPPEDPEAKKSNNFLLAKQYGIKAIPAIIACDTYGNCLQVIQSNELNSAGHALKITKDTTTKQKDLEVSVPKSYDGIAKKVKAEIDKKNISNSTVKELKKIAAYTGYKNTDEARNNLVEMNQIAADEFTALTGEGKTESDPLIINKLESFIYKYKDLPVAAEAEKLVKELKSQPKPK